jgi:hypothetical protein
MLRKAGGEILERSGFSWVVRAASDQLAGANTLVGRGDGVGGFPRRL